MFPRSTIVDEGRGLFAPPVPRGVRTSFPAAATRAGTALTVGPNIDVILGHDVVQQKTIGGVTVKTCNPGIDTAQNETAIAVNSGNAKNFVAGENDYRLYESTEDRYDGSGGFDTTLNGGSTWTAGFLPGLVKADTAAPGPYQSAGDPSLSAGPAGTFWYGNIAFDRNDNANAVSASVSHDGGKTWTTSFAIKTSATAGNSLFNDKAYIAADPTNANHAVVTWTQFHGPNPNFTSSDIVFSQTTNGGGTWSAPKVISLHGAGGFSQGSVPVIAGGKIYVVWEGTNAAVTADYIQFSSSSNGGSTWSAPKLLSVDSDIPGTGLPSWTPRVNSFPTFAVSGTTLHVAWPNWNGTHAELTYLRSTDGGTTWSTPKTLASSTADKFFAWLAASGTKVYLTYFNRANGAGDVYSYAAIGSSDGGTSWTTPVSVSTGTYNAGTGNEFSYPNCAFDFIGDYSGSAVDSSGVAHALWTGVTTGKGANQDPFTATLTLP